MQDLHLKKCFQALEVEEVANKKWIFLIAQYKWGLHSLFELDFLQESALCMDAYT